MTPFEHGEFNCMQDYCENSPFSCVGGLRARAELLRPSWISEEIWPEYRDGYESAARRMFGEEWRTVSFGWAPALTIGGES